MVAVTGTAVRRRGYLGALLGHGFRSVELAPNSWFVRSRRSATRVLWVGSRPHAAPQDILTMRLEFEDDPKALMAALTAVGVQVQDEHGEWLLRRPILARLEIALPTADWASLPILVLIPIEFFASLSLVAVAALPVVHWKAR